jgi:hypothetical protein
MADHTQIVSSTARRTLRKYNFIKVHIFNTGMGALQFQLSWAGLRE